MNEHDATKPMLPVPLTDSEAKAVAGGAFVLPKLAGCPTCTSGGFLDARAALALVVNPVMPAAGVSAKAF